MMNVNVPPGMMHSMAHPDAAGNARSGQPAGRPEAVHWFAYWSNVRPRNASAQQGAGLRAWAARSFASLRADAKKSETLPNLGLSRELGTASDC